MRILRAEGMFVSELILFGSENRGTLSVSNAKEWRTLSIRKEKAVRIRMTGMHNWNIGCIRNKYSGWR